MTPKTLEQKLFILSSLIVLLLLNLQIVQKEQIINHGQTFLLALAPVDPRSLIQGDYMELAYKEEQGRFIEQSEPRAYPAKSGFLIFKRDDKNVAHFLRFEKERAPLKPGEVRLRFRRQDKWVKIQPRSFLFQEGLGKLYEKAKYGLFKADKEGNALLINLADSNREPIKAK
ncbi:GDYXXLXY domain-containing protein [Magnetococcales bacterium HHB-1]